MSNVDFSLCPCGAIGCWGTSPTIGKCVLTHALDDYQMEFLEDKGLKFEGTARQNKVMAEIKKRIQVAEKHWPLLLRLKNARGLPQFEKRFLGDILCTPGAELAPTDSRSSSLVRSGEDPVQPPPALSPRDPEPLLSQPPQTLSPSPRWG